MARVKAASLLLCTLLSACATDGIPREVQRFVERRETCDYLRGEAGDYNGDTERERKVNDGIAKFCTGSDAELSRLRVRYRKDAAIMGKLAPFDGMIEAPRRQ
jgi:hypothetical protein